MAPKLRQPDELAIAARRWLFRRRGPVTHADRLVRRELEHYYADLLAVDKMIRFLQRRLPLEAVGSPLPSKSGRATDHPDGQLGAAQRPRGHATQGKTP